MDYVCISCGYCAKTLYHDYKGGIIKMAYCTKCGKVVDKYTEYDLVVVSLDALLLKRQAFRHVLINSRIESHWKFCIVLLICEAVSRLLQQSFNDQSRPWLSDNVLYSALEVDLYWNFISAAIELFCLLFGVLLCMSLWSCFAKQKISWREFVNGLMLSNFGKILVLPAILWGQKYSVVYTLLSNVFTIAANVQAVRVLCPLWNVPALIGSVFFGHFLSLCAKQGMEQLAIQVT